jgi:dihydrofolate synthase/folylpolyglutamate synthase
MTYNEAITYIHSINWSFCKPGLERIKNLCEKLGNPQDSLKFVHVAGTNGKGSFCSMLDSILREAGYKVGLFTSPYISEFNERIRFNGENISNEDLIEVTEYVRPIADAMEDKPTEFELITAIGFEYFKRKGCDTVILEAGLGGRLDSTNIIKTPILSVITGIALEHTEILGNTVEKIAAEKAGIIKAGVPVIFGGNDEAAGRVIAQKALEMGSSYEKVDRSSLKIEKADLDGSVFSFNQRSSLKISLLGTYQTYNAANVLTAVDVLQKNGYDISENAIKIGLSKAKWSARFEIISKNPLVIYDGAHNPQGVDNAVKSVLQYFEGERVCIISGVMKDKDYTYMAERISSVAHKVFTVTPDNPRSLDAKEYAKVFSKLSIDSEGYSTIDKAAEAAVKYCKDNGKALVCLGSLYMYADVKAAILKNI